MAKSKKDNKNEVNFAGVIVKVPEKAGSDEYKDNKCPFCGNVKVRGRNFIGIVVGKDTHRTATIENISKTFVPKYERYKRKRKKIRAHNPACINAGVGDRVRVFETKPLSKTKNFVIVENFGLKEEYLQKVQRIEEDKKHDKEKEEKRQTEVKKEEKKANKKKE